LDKEMKFLATLLLLVSTALFAGQPVEIVVPYPAGGATDKLARIVEEIFNKHGIKSYVTNKAGAAMTLFAQRVGLRGLPQRGPNTK
jgi:tripartite-type tricarboxylate transporter receptor subunit TctC